MAQSSQRAALWSITINNPTQEDRDALKAHPSFVKMVKYQDEIGDEGTLHIQGAVQTAQVRFAAIKKWLPRAHIEIARNKQALLNYVAKEDTAVPDTQVVVQADYLAMDSALKLIASYPLDFEVWSRTTSVQRRGKDHAFEKDEFWHAVRQILIQRPQAVGLFTNPQLERAWVNTRTVWKELYEKDRQTDRHEAEEEIISPVGI